MNEWRMSRYQRDTSELALWGMINGFGTALERFWAGPYHRLIPDNIIKQYVTCPIQPSASLVFLFTFSCAYMSAVMSGIICMTRSSRICTKRFFLVGSHVCGSGWGPGADSRDHHRREVRRRFAFLPFLSFLSHLHPSGRD